MKEEYFKKIPFRERKTFVRNSCLMYLKLKMTQEHYSKLNNSSEMNMQKLNGLSIFENIVNLMNTEQKLMFENEFLKNEYNPLWYLDHWCKSTYYKIKHETVNRFLFLLFS